MLFLLFSVASCKVHRHRDGRMSLRKRPQPGGRKRNAALSNATYTSKNDRHVIRVATCPPVDAIGESGSQKERGGICVAMAHWREMAQVIIADGGPSDTVCGRFAPWSSVAYQVACLPSPHSFLFALRTC